MSIRTRVFSLCLLLAGSCFALYAQRPANSNAIYQQLRASQLGKDVIAVNNLVLHRDAATFTLQQGSIAFYKAVDGKVTGAVFRGDGHFHLTPPNAQERHSLTILNHKEEFDEDFDQVIFRFADATSEELHKGSAGIGASGSEYGKEAQELHNFLRTQLKDNVDLRLLDDVLSPSQGGYFMAAIHGRKNSRLFFIVDPDESRRAEPEEVTLMSWNDWGLSYLAAFQRSLTANIDSEAIVPGGSRFHVDHENLDVSIERNGFLAGLATVHVIADQDGLAVVPLNLYSTLRVSRAETEKGEPLDFVQEKKDEDADFGVVLAAPLKKNESATIRIAYGGKDVVLDEGNGNYYPVARENWYPNGSMELGQFATYDMQFHIPKDLQLIATGTKVSEKKEGKITTTQWKTDVPLPVVGFNLGDFKMKEAKVPGTDLTIDAYANAQVPDSFIHHEIQGKTTNDIAEQDVGVDSISTTALLPMQLSQAQVAAQIYSIFYGPLPFSKVAVTQQFACTYGQSWPMLVYLPICGFMDQTQQHFLGIGSENLNMHMYWKVVTPHEMAHQWWGQTVGFRSYRDQWMSEGFADASASIFLQLTRPKPDDFLSFWKEEKKLITERNAFGFRPIDVGPVTMGYRLSSQKTGFDIYRDLVYPKGAYILHMIRMMMYSSKEGDDRFKATMHDFVSTYRLKSATTEDFKAIVEKHMSRTMDLDGNGKMDWFFNEYVYGTALPAYHFESQIDEKGGADILHFKLTQSGVSDDFKMLVPIYLELADGKIIHIGKIAVVGSTTIDQSVPLPKLPSRIVRASINHNYDVLSTDN